MASPTSRWPETCPSCQLETLEKMEVQFAWALRQVPSISEIRITVGGQPLPLPGGATEFSVYTGANYDPAGTYARGEMYGLSGGLAMRVLDGEAQSPLDGPVRSAAVRVARRLGGPRCEPDRRSHQRTGNGSSSPASRGQTSSAPRTVLSEGVDILHPAWDNSHRMWVVDRRPAGAVVSVVVRRPDRRRRRARHHRTRTSSTSWCRETEPGSWRRSGAEAATGS